MYRNGRPHYPSYPGFKRILCLTPCSSYGEISSFSLRDKKGRIVENVWQFSKHYESVPRSVQPYSRRDRRVIWDHPAEIHRSDGVPNEAYAQWRKKGMNHNEAVRFPVGRKHRTECVCAYGELTDGGIDTEHPLNYVKARKEIYLPLVADAVKKTEKFAKLSRLLGGGENLLIVEVDGPHQESLQYYRDKYGVAEDFLVDHSVLVTTESMELLINDTKHNFGHGYCLAMTLLGLAS